MHPIVFYANYALCSLTQPKRRRNSGVYSGLWSQWPTVLHFFVWLLQPRLGLQHKTVQKGFKRRNISSLEKRISNEKQSCIKITFQDIYRLISLCDRLQYHLFQLRSVIKKEKKKIRTFCGRKKKKKKKCFGESE